MLKRILKLKKKIKKNINESETEKGQLQALPFYFLNLQVIVRHLNSKIQMHSTNFLSLSFPLCLVIFGLSLIYPLPFDVREAHFYKLEGKSSNGSLVERHLAQDFWDCLFLCLNAVNKNCFSFNFGAIQMQGLHECELSNSEMKLEPENIQDRQGFTYYGMTDEVSSSSYLQYLRI